MTLTALAIAFLLVILLIAIFGQRLLSQKADSLKATNQERCTICWKSFEKSHLIERQIADVKILYFCKECIEGLLADLKKI